jgi:hypothetical protein
MRRGGWGGSRAIAASSFTLWEEFVKCGACFRKSIGLDRLSRRLDRFVEFPVRFESGHDILL